jgi:hypothetical protein
VDATIVVDMQVGLLSGVPKLAKVGVGHTYGQSTLSSSRSVVLRQSSRSCCTREMGGPVPHPDNEAGRRSACIFVRCRVIFRAAEE